MDTPNVCRAEGGSVFQVPAQFQVGSEKECLLVSHRFLFVYVLDNDYKQPPKLICVHRIVLAVVEEDAMENLCTVSVV